MRRRADLHEETAAVRGGRTGQLHFMSGTSLQALGCWKSYEMVLRYAHLAPEYLDVIPTDERAELVRLPSGDEIRLVTPPLFLATKLEALRTRGRRDLLASHDLEDIITVVDGRPALWSEVQGASSAVRIYIANEIAACSWSPDF